MRADSVSKVYSKVCNRYHMHHLAKMGKEEVNEGEEDFISAYYPLLRGSLLRYNRVVTTGRVS
jgi:hypothetical protein